MGILVALLAIAIVAAFLAVPAAVLMLLLGVLASLTGWACAIGFAPCFIIVLILAIFA